MKPGHRPGLAPVSSHRCAKIPPPRTTADALPARPPHPLPSLGDSMSDRSWRPQPGSRRTDWALERNSGAVESRNGNRHTGSPGDPAYVLATGAAADFRLRILHNLYGPGTHRALK